jgi:hypothetical protein
MRGYKKVIRSRSVALRPEVRHKCTGDTDFIILTRSQITLSRATFVLLGEKDRVPEVRW